MQNECNLILIRGVSGAGKSTVGILFENDRTVILSTDDMFMVDGKYVFDPSKLKIYHEATVDKVENLMAEYSWKVVDNNYTWFPTNRIVVCNTFTELWEMEPYFILAKDYDWRIHTIVVENRHGSNNVHDVPQKNIDEQKERFKIVL